MLGQKIKLVIAACLWNNPQVLSLIILAFLTWHSRSAKICVLDEPSNFLDREALGGLAVAIRDWAGAVVRTPAMVGRVAQIAHRYRCRLLFPTIKSS